MPPSYTEIEKIEPEKNGAGDSTSRPLLAASRQWREAYHSFRKSHNPGIWSHVCLNRSKESQRRKAQNESLHHFDTYK
ncbi:hypothetical protein J6590_054985 [Homalodisca vitripennis]|nr:hypothetical protein J6590_054985 [Homalodisca vitripennis]